MCATKDFTKWAHSVDLKTVEHIGHADSKTAKQENFIMRTDKQFSRLFLLSCTYSEWGETNKKSEWEKKDGRENEK